MRRPTIGHAVRWLTPAVKRSWHLFAGAGDRIADRARRTDRMMVRQDRGHWWRVVVGELGLFVITLAALLGIQLLDPGPLTVICSVLVGLQVGRVGIMSARRALAYRSGWLDGRAQMIASMGEAWRRGIDLPEWLQGEVERDLATLGLDPKDVPLPPEDGRI